jgi:hypothetical protein
VFPNSAAAPQEGLAATASAVWQRVQSASRSRWLSKKTLLICGGVAAAVLLLALVVRLVLPASPADKIIGSWQHTLSDGTTLVTYFAPDGTLTVTATGQKVQGTYHFVDRDWVVVELPGLPYIAGSPTGKMRVEFPQKGVLALMHENGVIERWQAGE